MTCGEFAVKTVARSPPGPGRFISIINDSDVTAPNPSCQRCEKSVLRREICFNLMRRRMLAVINVIKHRKLQVAHRLRLAARNHQFLFGTHSLAAVGKSNHPLAVKLSLSAVQQPAVVESGWSRKDEIASPSVTKVASFCFHTMMTMQMVLMRLQKMTTTIIIRLN